MAGLALVGVACSSADGGSAVTETAAPTSTVVTTASPAPATSALTPPTGDVDAGTAFLPAGEGLTFSLGEGWSATAVGEGTKPVLALGPDGSPGIAFLLEDFGGFIAYADAASGWEVDTVVEGYFYGPIGLAYAPDGTAHIAYHDHQEDSFVQDLGDLTVASQDGDEWRVQAIADDGHDGWDSTIAIGDDGILRAAGIDPQQFDREAGVEYFERTDRGWEVTEIGSGPIAYEFNVSLAIQPSGEPALTYFDNNAETLQYATRQAGEWTIETVDRDGSVGRYSSLAFDSNGAPHISYVDLTSATTATVRYATRAGGAWRIEDVDRLDAVLTGFTGARRITHTSIAPDGRPHIAYGDESVVRYATRTDGGWTTATIAEAGDLRLGQLVSFALDPAGVPHLSFFEVTRSNPLTGVIAYVTRES